MAFQAAAAAFSVAGSWRPGDRQTAAYRQAA